MPEKISDRLAVVEEKCKWIESKLQALNDGQHELAKQIDTLTTIAVENKTAIASFQEKQEYNFKILEVIMGIVAILLTAVAFFL